MDIIGVRSANGAWKILSLVKLFFTLSLALKLYIYSSSCIVQPAHLTIKVCTLLFQSNKVRPKERSVLLQPSCRFQQTRQLWKCHSRLQDCAQVRPFLQQSLRQARVSWNVHFNSKFRQKNRYTGNTPYSESHLFIRLSRVWGFWENRELYRNFLFTCKSQEFCERGILALIEVLIVDAIGSPISASVTANN